MVESSFGRNDHEDRQLNVASSARRGNENFLNEPFAPSNGSLQHVKKTRLDNSFANYGIIIEFRSP